jgi:hypothetical protein
MTIADFGNQVREPSYPPVAGKERSPPISVKAKYIMELIRPVEVGQRFESHRETIHPAYRPDKKVLPQGDVGWL